MDFWWCCTKYTNNRQMDYMLERGMYYNFNNRQIDTLNKFKTNTNQHTIFNS